MVQHYREEMIKKGKKGMQTKCAKIDFGQLALNTPGAVDLRTNLIVKGKASKKQKKRKNKLLRGD